MCLYMPPNPSVSFCGITCPYVSLSVSECVSLFVSLSVSKCISLFVSLSVSKCVSLFVSLSVSQVEVRSPEARDVHLALRAEWDVYKMILDLLRTTPKLERVYHETARRAFQFCRENKRQQEFKRLCDVLRSHFSLILKNRNKEDYEMLLRPELHLETRMQQLCVAADLELWRECSSTAEDIYSLGLHELLLRSLRSPIDLFHKAREKLLRWMALYFEKLSRVLWVGENYLFHALAWIKLFLHVKGFKKNAAPEDLQAMASVAVLAVLAIPAENM